MRCEHGPDAACGTMLPVSGGHAATACQCATQGYHGDLTPQEQATLRAVMLLRHQVRVFGSKQTPRSVHLTQHAVLDGV